MHSSLSTPQKLTRHAMTRMSQRGYTLRDVELIRPFGSPVRDGYLVTRADIEALHQDLQAPDAGRGHAVGRGGGNDGHGLPARA